MNRLGTTHRIRQLMAGPALVVVEIVATATIALSAVSPAAERAGGAARFVPADGAIVAERLDPVDGKPVEKITQHARIAGYAIAAEIPTAFSSGLDVLTASGVDLAHASYWISSTQQFTDSRETSRSRNVSVLTGEGIIELMLYGGNLSLIFDPPILQLPASPDVGDTWHQDGNALPGSRLHYHQAGGVVAVTDATRAARGCVATHNTTTLSSATDNSVLLSLDDIATWCPGAGIVADVGTVKGSGISAIPGSTVIGLDELGVTTQALETDRSSLPAIGPQAALSKAAVPLVFSDVTFGVSAVHGQTSLRPIALNGGRLVIVEATTNDVIMFTAGADGALSEAWRRHPGGVVLSVVSAAGLIVATTAGRSVTAYSPNGAPRWTQLIDDASVSGAAAAGDVIVVGTLSGSVYGFASSSGAELWRHGLADSIVAPPVSTRGLAVIAAADGELAAFSPGGEVAWSTNFPALTALAASSTIVAVAGQGTVRQLDATTGAALTSTPFAGSLASIRIDDNQLIVFDDEAVVSIALARGDVLWSAAGSRDVALVAGGVLAGAAGIVEFRDHSSGTARSWSFDKSAYTDARLASTRDWFVPMQGAVLLVDANLLVVRLAGARS